MGNLTLEQAAAQCLCSPDHMRDLAAAGEVPATKIGRRWVFSADLLDEWIKQRCRSTKGQAATNGGSKSPSLASRLAARRAQRIGSRPKNSSSESVTDCGVSTNSGTVVQLRGPMPQNAG